MSYDIMSYADDTFSYDAVVNLMIRFNSFTTTEAEIINFLFENNGEFTGSYTDFCCKLNQNPQNMTNIRKTLLKLKKEGIIGIDNNSIRHYYLTNNWLSVIAQRDIIFKHRNTHKQKDAEESNENKEE